MQYRKFIFIKKIRIEKKIKIMWILYIIKCNDNSLYTGITKDIKKRLQGHTNGTAAKYTRGRGPFQLLYLENHLDRSQATKNEYKIKKLSLVQKLKLIQEYSDIL